MRWLALAGLVVMGWAVRETVWLGRDEAVRVVCEAGVLQVSRVRDETGLAVMVMCFEDAAPASPLPAPGEGRLVRWDGE